MINKLLRVEEGDLSGEGLELARSSKLVAIDIDLETSGLDWRKDTIATCQVYIPGDNVFIVRCSPNSRKNLELMLRDDSIKKIFHHAAFDLSFIAKHWSIFPANVCCTKIASKILNPNREDHSLKSLLLDFLGVRIDKTLQLSNWFDPILTKDQLEYAARDVVFLPDLLTTLSTQVKSKGLLPLLDSSYRFLPDYIRFKTMGGVNLFGH